MRLADELKDVCEVDRLKYGYNLVWDDGTATRVMNAEEARQKAAERRESQPQRAA